MDSQINTKDLCAPEHLKDIILNGNKPLLIKKHVNWGLLKWSLEDWKRLLKNEKMIFRCGKKLFTKQPQWERTTHTKTSTFEDFLLFTETNNEEWMYFDYKYLKEWFNNVEDIGNGIDWGVLGFPELSFKDSTIWIGSAGAHTPCHIDTYGCNLVVQIYGRKQWILFPPGENLRQSRIPYEESSIYSTLNFFSPSVGDFKGITNCRKIILEPGDALFVPHKWWHYVENLDTAISVNVWIPLVPIDHEERLKESLVQLFIAQISKNLNKEVRNIILNPNSDEIIEDLNLVTSLNLVEESKKKTKMLEEKSKNEATSFRFDEYLFLRRIPQLSENDFYNFLQNQRNRFTNEDDSSSDYEELIKTINAFVHPDVVRLIENKLLQ